MYTLVNCADDCALFRQIVFRPFPKYSARDPLASDLSPPRSAAGQRWEGLFSKTHQGQRLKVYFRITSEKGRGKCFLTTTTDNNGHKLILQQQKAHSTQLASLNAHQYLFESLASVCLDQEDTKVCRPASRGRFLRQNEWGRFVKRLPPLVEKMWNWFKYLWFHFHFLISTTPRLVLLIHHHSHPPEIIRIYQYEGK